MVVKIYSMKIVSRVIAIVISSFKVTQEIQTVKLVSFIEVLGCFQFLKMWLSAVYAICSDVSSSY